LTERLPGRSALPTALFADGWLVAIQALRSSG